LLYFLAAKYIFGNGQLPGMVTKLNSTTKNFTSGLMSDPQKVEGIISMVRTVAPLTSPHTVSMVNTYLPFFEKVSTLLGMYSFLNRAQTFRPIESLNTKNPADMMSAFMKNGNIPVGKLLAQPLIAGNMDKIMGAVASNMLKNGNINDIMKNVNINDLLASVSNNSGTNQSEGISNADLRSLMETFMPLLNSMSTNESKNEDDKKSDFKNESAMNDEEHENSSNSSDTQEYNNEATYNYNENAHHKNSGSSYDRNYRNDQYDSYNKPTNYSEHKNNYNDRREPQRPIRIKQRKRK